MSSKMYLHTLCYDLRFGFYIGALIVAIAWLSPFVSMWTVGYAVIFRRISRTKFSFLFFSRSQVTYQARKSLPRMEDSNGAYRTVFMSFFSFPFQLSALFSKKMFNNFCDGLALLSVLSECNSKNFFQVSPALKIRIF